MERINLTYFLYSILSCGVEKHTRPYKDCEMLKLAETCSNDINPDCIGFWKIYVRQFMSDHEYRKIRRPQIGDLPDCFQHFLALETKEIEFPTFEKLINELVLIQKLLKSVK